MSTLPAVRTIDAQALLAQAIDKGTDVDTLERLVALGKDMLELQARQAFAEAMAAFHRDCPTIHKNATGNITTRTGAAFSYRYPSLDEIMRKVRPVLGLHGLSVSWRIPRTEPDKVVRVCRISHALGHYEESGEVVIPIGGPEDRSAATPAQRVGIAISYAERYSVKDVLGLAPEMGEDTDGNVPAAGGGEEQSRHDDRAPVVQRADGSAVVVNVDTKTGTRKSGETWTRYLVRFDDGREGSTFDEPRARAAQQAQQNGELMIPTLKQSGEYVNLLGLFPAESPESNPADAVTLISEKQQKMLHAVIRGSGWGTTDQDHETALHDLLAKRQITHLRDVPEALFDDILQDAKAGPKKK